MGKETVEHYLLECRRYKEQRKVIKGIVGHGFILDAIDARGRIIQFAAEHAGKSISGCESDIITPYDGTWSDLEYYYYLFPFTLAYRRELRS
jgi:hypothetical protein